MATEKKRTPRYRWLLLLAAAVVIGLLVGVLVNNSSSSPQAQFPGSASNVAIVTLSHTATRGEAEQLQASFAAMPGVQVATAVSPTEVKVYFRKGASSTDYVSFQSRATSLPEVERVSLVGPNGSS